ncbi:MAG: PQQ-binding-like beta-propeller repeat protein [Nannocystaceae bacterium]|nr:PQQ-binding-like beta-propeller repeat protein [Nannocystaceae bacterium]
MQDDSWRRGGPAGDRPSRGRGPVLAPKAAWEVDLGSVVFARPTLGTDAKGRTVAYVGTHAGRFAGVLADGPEAGSIVTDLTLGGMVWSTAAQDARGRLYVGADDDTLYAIEPGASKIVWSKKLGNCNPARAPGPEGARCDVDGGPTLGPDGDLYVGADGVYRITTGGAIVWHWPADEDGAKHVFSSPLVTKDGLVVFGGQDGFVTALHADGTQAWRYGRRRRRRFGCRWHRWIHLHRGRRWPHVRPAHRRQPQMELRLAERHPLLGGGGSGRYDLPLLVRRQPLQPRSRWERALDAPIGRAHRGVSGARCG